MHEMQNDLLFRYCFIYLLNGLMDVLGSYIKQRLLSERKKNEIDCNQESHPTVESDLPSWLVFVMSSF